MLSRTTFLRIVTLLLLLISSLLTACGDATPTTTPATATTAATTNQPVTVEMWVMPNSFKAADDVQKILGDFYKANPNIKVNITVLDWTDALNKINFVLQSGTGPDIIQAGTTWIGGFAATKGLRPFTAAEVQAMGGPTNFTQAAWNTATMLGSNDVVAIPWIVETRALFYRTDVLGKAGLDPSTAFKDWPTFADTLRKMKDAGAGMIKAPFAYPGKGDWNVVHNFAPWVWGAGGDILSKDGTKAIFNNVDGVYGVQYYAKLYSEGLTFKEGLEKNTADIEAFWGNGDIGSFISGPWMVRNARISKDLNGYLDTITAKNYAVTTLPAGQAGSKPFVGGSDLIIPKSSKNPDAAVKVVQHLVTKKAQLDYVEITGHLPATREGQADPRYTNDPYYKPFLESLKTGRTYPVVPAWNGIEESLKKNLSLLWDDIAAGRTTTVKERLDSAAKEVDILLAASK